MLFTSYKARNQTTEEEDLWLAQRLVGGGDTRLRGGGREPLPQAASGESLADLGEGVVQGVGREMDLGKLPKRPAFENLPRRSVAEAHFRVDQSQPARMAKDYEKLCSTGEALIHATMARLIARRLARA